MHKYLRAVGFSNIKSQKEVKELIERVVEKSTESWFGLHEDETIYGDYRLKVNETMGIAACGEYDNEDNFNVEFYYPYMVTNVVSSKEHSLIERHAATTSYAGVCEDNRIGITIIYYLINRVEYFMSNKKVSEASTGKNMPVCLSGLSIDGTIMMPLDKSALIEKKQSHNVKKRDKLIEAARKGSEEAIESLTLDDLDVYSNIAKRLHDSDVYSIVDTSFMPYGVECDEYSILGEIKTVRLVKNEMTGEEIYEMKIVCNRLEMTICINKNDLYGEPLPGRRFKGTIWLQGNLVT